MQCSKLKLKNRDRKTVVVNLGVYRRLKRSLIITDYIKENINVDVT